MDSKLRAILDDLESDVDRATQAASLRLEMYIKAKFEEWRGRFPRHHFTAWEGHGLLSIDVSPPVMGSESLDLMNPDGLRGAVAEIVKEARAIVDAFNDSSEIRAGIFVDKITTA